MVQADFFCRPRCGRRHQLHQTHRSGSGFGISHKSALLANQPIDPSLIEPLRARADYQIGAVRRRKALGVIVNRERFFGCVNGTIRNIGRTRRLGRRQQFLIIHIANTVLPLTQTFVFQVEPVKSQRARYSRPLHDRSDIGARGFPSLPIWTKWHPEFFGGKHTVEIILTRQRLAQSTRFFNVTGLQRRARQPIAPSRVASLSLGHGFDCHSDVGPVTRAQRRARLPASLGVIESPIAGARKPIQRSRVVLHTGVQANLRPRIRQVICRQSFAIGFQ